MKKLENSIGPWIIQYRLAIIVISLVIVGATALGSRYLTFKNDSRIYFSDDNPQLLALEKLETTFSRDYNVLFVVAPENGNVFTNINLQAVKELTAKAWETPYSTRVNSITNFQHTYADGDDLMVEDLVADAEILNEKTLSKIQHIALSEPLLVNRLISPSGHVTGVSVLITKPGKSDQENAEIATYSRKLAEQITKKYPEIKIYLTGGVMIDDAFGEATRNDMKTLIPIMYLTLVVVIGLALRSFSGTIITFLVIVGSMVTGMGLAGWFNIELSPSSAGAPTIILTLAVADSIHILATFFILMRRGQEKNEAIAESLRINLQPVFITSLTTAIGFLTMNFSDAPPFRDFGNIVAMGVGAAFLYSVFFLPAMISLMPFKSKKASAHSVIQFDTLASFIISYRNRLFWIILISASVLIAGMTRIELNDDFTKYFDHRYAFRRATDFTQQNLTGFYIIEYGISAGEKGGINNPLFLRKLDEFGNWYRQQPYVAHVYSLADTMKQLNKNMHGDDPAQSLIPASRELAAQYLLLYEMSLPFGLDLNNIINVDKSSTRFIVRLKNADSKSMRELDENARNWLIANTPRYMHANGTGMSLLLANVSKRNIESMLGASFGALLVISVILMAVLKSLKIGAISLVPNIIPAFVTFGIWGYLVGQVGLVVSVVAALTLGIVVDDTTHFLSKYLRARREHGATTEEAVRYAFNTVASALVITTVILTAGFVVLSFSGFLLNANQGLMTSITIVIALILDLLFLPALLLKFDNSSPEK